MDSNVKILGKRRDVAVLEIKLPVAFYFSIPLNNFTRFYKFAKKEKKS